MGPIIALAAILGGLLSGPVNAQARSPIPTFTGKRVYVEDVPDQFEGLNDQIARLEKASPQTYYVVVVKSSGSGPAATKDFVEEISQTWRKQASGRGLSFNADRSVIVAVALENRQLAMLPGQILKEKFGLRSTEVERELINKPVIALAKEGKYTEAISTLLYSTHNWIAARDRATAKVSDTVVTASTPAAIARATPSGTTSPAIPPTTATAPAVRESSNFVLIILGVVILGTALGYLAWKWSRHQSTRHRLAGRIKGLRSKAVEVMDRLDGLKERLNSYPRSADFTEPMAGETLAFFKSVEQKIGTLWDGWLQIMESLDKAQKLEAKAGGSPLSTKTLDEVEEMMNRQGTFEDIEIRAKASAAELDRLAQAHQAAREALAAVTACRPKIDAGLAGIKKVNLPVEPYQEELRAVDAETTTCGARAAGDPIGAKSALEQLRARAQALLDRIDRVAAEFKDAQQARSGLEMLTKQVAGVRQQGLRLIEEGGNPDTPIQQGVEAYALVLTALESGDPEEGAKALATIQGKLQEAKSTLESVQKAKAFCERELTARPRETERLRQALPEAESYQANLDREFARESWQPVARNLEQAKALLATFDRQAADAAASANSTSQQYLAGARGYEQLAQQQQIVLRLMAGLSEQLNSLIQVRTECKKLIDELGKRERQVELYMTQNAAIVGDVARASFASACKAGGDIAQRANQARPDWPSIRQYLAEISEEYAISQSQAEDDVKHYEALITEFEQVRQTAGRVYALLASHTEDRLAANQHYQAAADSLDRVGAQINEPRGLAARLLEEVRGAAQDLERSEQLALEDLRLAAQANSEINEAHRSIRETSGYSAMGYMADTSTAQNQLNQAQQAMQSQGYEQAIQLAGAAIQSAKQSYYAAMQQALMRQAMIMADQRRAYARSSAPPYNGVSFGAAAAAAAAAAILGNSVSAAESGPGDYSADTGAGGGSWGDDAGQGSW
jgi:hypothetical protein